MEIASTDVETATGTANPNSGSSGGAPVLLDHWLDPQAHADVEKSCSKYGTTPLHVAAAVDSAESAALAQWLVQECGADVLARSKGGATPLDKALGTASGAGGSSARKRYTCCYSAQSE